MSFPSPTQVAPPQRLNRLAIRCLAINQCKYSITPSTLPTNLVIIILRIKISEKARLESPIYMPMRTRLSGRYPPRYIHGVVEFAPAFGYLFVGADPNFVVPYIVICARFILAHRMKDLGGGTVVPGFIEGRI